MARGSKIMMLSGAGWNYNLDKYYLLGHMTRLARELLQQWHSILFSITSWILLNIQLFNIYIERNIASLKSTDCCHEFALWFWKYPCDCIFFWMTNIQYIDCMIEKVSVYFGQFLVVKTEEFRVRVSMVLWNK